MAYTLDNIQKILDKKVRPELWADGGDIVIHSFKDDILSVRMTGKCNNCPSAMATMENVVKAELMEAFPQLKDILLITGVSDETLDMARKILAMRHADDNKN